MTDLVGKTVWVGTCMYRVRAVALPPDEYGFLLLLECEAGYLRALPASAVRTLDPIEVARS